MKTYKVHLQTLWCLINKINFSNVRAGEAGKEKTFFSCCFDCISLYCLFRSCIVVFGEEQQQFIYSKVFYKERLIRWKLISKTHRCWFPQNRSCAACIYICVCVCECVCLCINNYMNRSSRRSVIQLIVRAYGDMVEQGRRRCACGWYFTGFWTSIPKIKTNLKRGENATRWCSELYPD